MYLKPTRRPISAADADLVRVSALRPDRQLPALVIPEFDGVDLAAWMTGERARIEDLMLRHGGLLFRGFGVRTPAVFQQVVSAFCPETIEYTERSTPRTKVSDFLYTSTEYPPDQTIPLHNENSYSHTWPRYIWFFCERAAERGGETSIADSRHVFQLLDPALRQRFAQRKVTYVRNYSPHLGLSWQETFQTESREQVEAYCRLSSIACEWKGDRLTTRQTRQATERHPCTGEMLWFNQAHLFHTSSLPPAIYRSLLATVSEEEFPRHAYYGDGAPIEPDALLHIRDVYERAAMSVRWKPGDVLLLDNMLTAHGRLPYRGARRVLVAMAKPYDAL